MMDFQHRDIVRIEKYNWIDRKKDWMNWKFSKQIYSKVYFNFIKYNVRSDSVIISFFIILYFCLKTRSKFSLS